MLEEQTGREGPEEEEKRSELSSSSKTSPAPVLAPNPSPRAGHRLAGGDATSLFSSPGWWKPPRRGFLISRRGRPPQPRVSAHCERTPPPPPSLPHGRPRCVGSVYKPPPSPARQGCCSIPAARGPAAGALSACDAPAEHFLPSDGTSVALKNQQKKNQTTQQTPNLLFFNSAPAHRGGSAVGRVTYRFGVPYGAVVSVGLIN